MILTRVSFILLIFLLQYPPCLLVGETESTAKLRFSPSPIVYGVSPLGAQTGTTTLITVEGINLEDSPRLIFSQSGVQARILGIERLPNPPYQTPRQRLKFYLDVDLEAKLGSHGFRIKTRYGTSNWISFALGKYSHVEETSPNGTSQDSQKVDLPVTVQGLVERGGRGDFFRFQARAGQELVFHVEAASLGSRLDSVLEFLDHRGILLAQNDNFFPDTRDSVLAVPCPRNGEYQIRISDRGGRGGRSFAYRLTMGEIPLLTGVFPLGVRRGRLRKARIKGDNLGTETLISLDGRQSISSKDHLQLGVQTPLGQTLNTQNIALGEVPEILETEPNNRPTKAQTLPVPVTVNGIVGSRNDQDLFRFPATRDKVLVLEVQARRLSSPLDSVVQILDLSGKPIPRAILRALSEDFHDTALRAGSLLLNRFGLENSTSYLPLDFVFLDRRELIRLDRSIRRADHFSVAQGILGQRLSWLGTDPQNHPSHGSVHKVQILPYDTLVKEDFLPNFTLYYRNDDGGPLHGKDSYLLFSPPEDGEYLLQLEDLENKGSDRHSYRLTIRPAQPDFELFLDDGFLLYVDGRASGARNPNVPRGGSVPLTVSAARLEGFNGPIQVKVEGLPPGFHATEGIIRPQELVTTLVLSANETAMEPSELVDLRVVGLATIGGHIIKRKAWDPLEPLNLVSLVPHAPIVPWLEPADPIIRSGESIQLTINIQRRYGFNLDVPFILQNRPAGIWIEDSGSNGIVISKGETSRTLTLRADSWVQATTFPLIAVGRVKSEAVRRRRSGAKAESADYSAFPILVTVEAKED